MKKFFSENTYSAPAVILGLSLVFTALVLSFSFDNFSNKKDSLVVTGSSERLVKSDTAKLIITINRRADTAAVGNKEVQSDANKIKII
jgi:hypothetical protein